LLHSIFSAPRDPLRLSPLLQARSGQVLEAVRKLGLEGVVGKRLGSIYEPGERSGAWIKLRANMEQEFVIGGYIPRGPADLMRCSSAFTRGNNSSSSQR
jgi:bifunctional non-homologous end joining protein LigD